MRGRGRKFLQKLFCCSPYLLITPVVPDLVFSEMRFLQRKKAPNDIEDSNRRSNTDGKRRNSQSCKQEVSAYFNRPDLVGRKTSDGSHTVTSQIDEEASSKPGRRRKYTPPSAFVKPTVEKLSVDLPNRPFLGFGNKGARYRSATPLSWSNSGRDRSSAVPFCRDSTVLDINQLKQPKPTTEVYQTAVTGNQTRQAGEAFGIINHPDKPHEEVCSEHALIEDGQKGRDGSSSRLEDHRAEKHKPEACPAAQAQKDSVMSTTSKPFSLRDILKACDSAFLQGNTESGAHKANLTSSRSARPFPVGHAKSHQFLSHGDQPEAHRLPSGAPYTANTHPNGQWLYLPPHDSSSWETSQTVRHELRPQPWGPPSVRQGPTSYNGHLYAAGDRTDPDFALNSNQRHLQDSPQWIDTPDERLELLEQGSMPALQHYEVPPAGYSEHSDPGCHHPQGIDFECEDEATDLLHRQYEEHFCNPNGTPHDSSADWHEYPSVPNEPPTGDLESDTNKPDESIFTPADFWRSHRRY